MRKFRGLPKFDEAAGRVQFLQLEEVLESNYFQIGQHVVRLRVNYIVHTSTKLKTVTLISP